MRKKHCGLGLQKPKAGKSLHKEKHTIHGQPYFVFLWYYQKNQNIRMMPLISIVSTIEGPIALMSPKSPF